MASKYPQSEVVHDKQSVSEHTEFPSDLQHAGHAIQLAEDADKAVYRPFSASMWRLYGCLAIAYLCGCLNGYDGSLMGGLNAMSTYQQYFDMYVSPS